MLSRSARHIAQRAGRSIAVSRLYSKVPAPDAASAKDIDEDERRRQAAELAVQSIKDIGSMFSSEAPDEETKPIDTRPIFEDPSLFGTLSLLHQGQVVKELQDKYDKKWTKLTEKDKKLGYYVAYGNWGSRDKFDNWKSVTVAPYDLPFAIPSKIATLSPGRDTKTKMLSPAVNLAETAIRKPQFEIKRIDGSTKVFLYLIVVVALIAVYRDKYVGEEGMPREQVIVDPYEERRLENERKKLEEEAEAERKRNAKWYYLWLR